MADCIFKGKSYDEISRILTGRGLWELAKWSLDGPMYNGRDPWKYLQQCDFEGFAKAMKYVIEWLEERIQTNPALARLYKDHPRKLRAQLKYFSGYFGGTSQTWYIDGDKLSYTWSGNTVRFSDGSTFEVHYNYVLVIKRGSEFNEAVKQIKALTFGKPVITYYEPVTDVESGETHYITPSDEVVTEPSNTTYIQPGGQYIPYLISEPEKENKNTMYMMMALVGVIALAFLLKK